MNKKISISSNSKIVEYLNEQLAMENAVADRLVTRIHETSIPDLKQHLEQNLQETMARQERMYQLISDLGVCTPYAPEWHGFDLEYRFPTIRFLTTWSIGRLMIGAVAVVAGIFLLMVLSAGLLNRN